MAQLIGQIDLNPMRAKLSERVLQTIDDSNSHEALTAALVPLRFAQPVVANGKMCEV